MSQRSFLVSSLLAALLLAVAVHAAADPVAPAGSIFRLTISGTS